MSAARRTWHPLVWETSNVKVNIQGNNRAEEKQKGKTRSLLGLTDRVEDAHDQKQNFLRLWPRKKNVAEEGETLCQHKQSWKSEKRLQWDRNNKKANLKCRKRVLAFSVTNPSMSVRRELEPSYPCLWDAENLGLMVKKHPKKLLRIHCGSIVLYWRCQHIKTPLYRI